MNNVRTRLKQLFLLNWLLLPNFMLLAVYNDALPLLPVFLIIFGLVSLLYLYCFPTLGWFAWINLPFALCSGFYAAYIFEYGSIPYEGMWYSIWDMVYLEFFDLIRYYPEVFIFSLGGFALYLWCLVSLHKSPATRPVHRKSVLLACLLTGMLIIGGQNLLSDRLSFVSQDYLGAFLQSYPLGMVFQAHSTWVESRERETVQVTSIPDLPRTTPPLDEKELFVLVIGETARADRWHADLQAHDYANIESTNSVSFGDAFSQANFTDGSLLLMLTGSISYAEARDRPTLPLILKASGCETIWISNNKAYRYSHQADYAVITEQSTSTPLIKRYDHSLLPVVYRSLAQGRQRSCLIIHLLGSHFSYHQRYPGQFKLKDVDLEAYSNKSSAEHVTALRNAYDNSIHATNDLLEKIIEAVRQQSATSVVMYTSDHGENLYDDERGLFQHILVPPSRYEVTVPLLVWVSERFTEQFPDKWSNLVANGHRPVSNRQVLPTFVDLMGVDYDVPNFDNSLFADYPTDAPRYVLGPNMKLLTEYEVE